MCFLILSFYVLSVSDCIFHSSGPKATRTEPRVWQRKGSRESTMDTDTRVVCAEEDVARTNDNVQIISLKWLNESQGPGTEIFDLGNKVTSALLDLDDGGWTPG